MQDLLLIDADALKESWVRSDHKGTLIDFIDNAPLVPAVPLADHERMKRELYSDINAFQSMARGLAIQLDRVTAERNQAVEDLRKAAQCDTCRHNGDIFCNAEACKDGDQWQWRGVTEKQTLSATVKNNILNDFMKGVEE